MTEVEYSGQRWRFVTGFTLGPALLRTLVLNRRDMKLVYYGEVAKQAELGSA